MDPRKSILAVAAVAVVLSGAGGCAESAEPATSAASSRPSPSPSPSVDPMAELAASTQALTTGTYQVTRKAVAADGDESSTASVDPVAKNATLVSTATVEGTAMKIEILLLGTDRYTRFTGIPGMSSAKWQHLDATKAEKAKDLTVSALTDPMGATAFMKAVLTAQKVGPGRYTGTFDPSKAEDAVGATTQELPKLAAAAKTLPFEASLDDKGRLATLKFTVPEYGINKQSAVEAQFSGYGAPVTLAKPAANQVTEAPASVYEILS